MFECARFSFLQAGDPTGCGRQIIKDHGLLELFRLRFFQFGPVTGADEDAALDARVPAALQVNQFVANDETPGKVDAEFVARFLDHAFFARRPPKSLDRDDFAPFRPDHLNAADGAATLAACTVAAALAARRHLPTAPVRWLITGGGRHNRALMKGLAAGFNVPVEPVDVMGWDGDALEAQAFGYLAVRSLKGLPLSFPGTTRVPAPQAGGRLDRPPVC